MTDSELLRTFSTSNDQGAFRELVRRHVDLVYATARRLMNGDAHAAQDVTQMVFADLARKSGALVNHPCLAGWLHTCVRFNAIDTFRRERRRQQREQHVTPATSGNEPPNEAWEHVAPLIDDALHDLDERDRHFVLLRYFENQPMTAIATRYGVTENTVQKAIGRALDLLSASLARRDITSSAAALAVALPLGGASAPQSLVAIIASTAARGTTADGSLSAAASVLVKLAAVIFVSGAVGFWAYWRGAAQQQAADAVESVAQAQFHQANARRLVERLQKETRRASAAEADTATLLHAVEQARVEREQALARATSLAAVTPPPATLPYAIRPGDTGARIALNTGVTLAALREVNPNVNFTRLRVGQVIQLPPGAQPANVPSAGSSAPGPAYIIKPDDSLESIARAMGISQVALRQANPDVNWEQSVVGRAIRVP